MSDVTSIQQEIVLYKEDMENVRRALSFFGHEANESLKKAIDDFEMNQTPENQHKFKVEFFKALVYTDLGQNTAFAPDMLSEDVKNEIKTLTEELVLDDELTKTLS